MSFQSDNQFPQRELFGGAVTSNIFSNFEDLSNFRPVRLYYYILLFQILYFLTLFLLGT